ncbi:MAG: glycosyltransferase family 39 protein [bacterium]
MRRRDALLLFGAALAIRALYIAQLRGYDLADILILDPRAYDAEAQRILAGEPLRSAFYQAPFYSYFLAAIYKLFGREFLAVRAIQCVLGAATVVFTASLGARLFGRTAGLVAGILALLYGVFPYYEGQIMKTSLTVFLTTLLLYIVEPIARRTAPAPTRDSAVRAGIAGILLGCATLTRENLILFAPAAALLFYFRARDLAASIAFAAGVALAILPVTLHNFRAEGEWILVTSQGGQNFYIGNHEAATGTYTNPMFVRPDPLYERIDFQMEAVRRTEGALTAGEASSFWYGQALREMLANPMRAAGLLCKKVIIVFEGVERPDNESLYVLRDAAPVLDVLSLSFAVVAALGFLGMILSRARAGEFLFLHLFALVNVAALALFFVVSRYRVALAPVLMIFAAYALVRTSQWARERAVKPLAGAGAFIAAVLALLSVPTWAGPDPRDYESVNHFLNRGRIYSAGNQLVEAAENYRRAVALADTLAFMRFEYADVLRRMERPREALDQLSAAVRIRPEFPTARNNLGILLAEDGDLASAEREFREAARLAPSWPDPLHNLARVYEITGQTAARDAALAAAERVARQAQEGNR